LCYPAGPTTRLPLRRWAASPSVTNVPSRLFDDVSPEQSLAGATHYRCIYIANDNASETLFHCTIAITEDVDLGAEVSLGFVIQDDIQQVVITNGTSVTSGDITLSHDGDDFTFSYNASLSTWASNFENAIQAIADLEEVTVSATTSGIESDISEVTFGESAGNRFHPTLEVEANTLSPATQVSVLKITDGGPLNTVAPEIDAETTTPAGIVFYSPTEDDPLDIGELRPSDMLPVWIKRTVGAETEALADDGFTLEFLGEPIE
jgi:hypothetical protein